MEILVGLAVCCAILILVGSCSASAILPVVDETITVTNKERGSDKTPDLIWAIKADGSLETFQVEDNWFKGKYNSSDTYGLIQISQKYNAKVTGFRMGFLSTYRNILEVSKVDESTADHQVEAIGPAQPANLAPLLNQTK